MFKKGDSVVHRDYGTHLILKLAKMMVRVEKDGRSIIKGILKSGSKDPHIHIKVKTSQGEIKLVKV